MCVSWLMTYCRGSSRGHPSPPPHPPGPDALTGGDEGDGEAGKKNCIVLACEEKESSPLEEKLHDWAHRTHATTLVFASGRCVADGSATGRHRERRGSERGCESCRGERWGLPGGPLPSLTPSGGVPLTAQSCYCGPVL